MDPGRTDLLSQAVLDLLRDPDRLRQMGSAAGRDFLARHSVAVRNQRLLSAYTAAGSAGGTRVIR